MANRVSRPWARPSRRLVPGPGQAATAIAAAVLTATAWSAHPRVHAPPTPSGAERPSADDPGAGATDAALARAWLGSLDPDARGAAIAPFDDPDRTRWAYTPMSRAGVPLGAMSPQAVEAARSLIRSGLGPRGAARADEIIQLEAVLGELEFAAGWARAREVRDPALYVMRTYGDVPADAEASPWAWRFEGHHLSVNVTVLDAATRVVAPVFMGANPARVPDGPYEGRRVLAAEEDMGRALLRGLDDERRSTATISDRAPADILSRNDPVAPALPPAGLAYADMTTPQQEMLQALLHVYLARMAPDQASMQRRRIDAAGLDAVRFAWAGSSEPGQPHYYRVQGPTFLIEYDNVQNGANHVHTVWRDLEHDFGGDLLRAHYARHAADPGHGHDGHGHDGHGHDGHEHDEHSYDEHGHDEHDHDGDGHRHGPAPDGATGASRPTAPPRTSDES